ncbi:hypothetical protein [Streptacidiphilus sp. PB12-B1b]|uniref:hypothetical protein n=1 Tax=Streptacidiphilus sp. PB12-B1b TaxID=2705012 RepID=UPI001CDC7EA4|nr:hypothetical protein [Streptacidiphilus sp. PB12-B1b]
MIASGRIQEDASGLITLTPAGQEVITKLTEARIALLNQKLEGWSPEQHAVLVQMLRELADNSMDAPGRVMSL